MSAVAVAYQEQRSFTVMHDQLVEYAASLGVPPEVILAVRSRYWPAADVVEFAIMTGLDLCVLLGELDRFRDYV